MRTLINFPHGLGDYLMMTPTLRDFEKSHGHRPEITILRRFESSQIFEHCPHISKIWYVPDPWHDFKNSTIGFQEVERIGKEICENSITIPCNKRKHKIHLHAETLNVKLSSTDMEIYTSKGDKYVADHLIKKYVGDNPFGFVQTIAGNKKKNLPAGYGKKWLKENKNLDHIIEVGETFPFNEYNINIQFEILRRASAICVTSSVFYVAAMAMDKDIDFVYFRMRRNHRRVGNINPRIKENVVYKL